MQNVMQDRLSRMGLPDETKIIVKIYMNLQGVSQAFHRYGSTGSQARAIAPFTSAFSKCELYDIVDCGENRECCEAKIKGMYYVLLGTHTKRSANTSDCRQRTLISTLTMLPAAMSFSLAASPKPICHSSKGTTAAKTTSPSLEPQSTLPNLTIWDTILKSSLVSFANPSQMTIYSAPLPRRLRQNPQAGKHVLLVTLAVSTNR